MFDKLGMKKVVKGQIRALNDSSKRFGCAGWSGRKERGCALKKTAEKSSEAKRWSVLGLMIG